MSKYKYMMPSGRKSIALHKHKYIVLFNCKLIVLCKHKYIMYIFKLCIFNRLN